MSSGGSRLYHLDLLRGLLMMLGVVLHTMAVFSVDGNWNISADKSVAYADPVRDFIHLFRMPAFFIIAGFFSALVLMKQGEKQYLKTRLVRLGIPLLFAGLVFNLPLSPFINSKLSEEGWLTYIISGQWLGHLWFLGVLILYSFFLALIWRKALLLVKNRVQYTWVISLGILVLVYPVTLRLSWLLYENGLGLVFATTSNLFQYLPYFLFGIVFFFHQGSMKIEKRIVLWLGLSIVFYWLRELNTMPLIRDMLSFLQNVSLSLVLFSMFERLFSAPSAWKKQLADSSYTIYLVHQPIIILIGLLILSFSMNAHVQLWVILGLTTLLAYVIHNYIVKNNAILMFLMNGKRIREEAK